VFSRYTYHGGFPSTIMTAYDKKSPGKPFATRGSKPNIPMEAPRGSADEEEVKSKEAANECMKRLYAGLVHGRQK
jgi:hypothetical protein